MNVPPWIAPTIACFVWQACWFAGGLGLVQAADPAITDSSHSKLLQAWSQNAEVRQCGLCHFSPGNDFAQRDTAFCQLTELATWLTHDKHAVSRQRIEPVSRSPLAGPDAASQSWVGETNYLSYSICQKLGYEVDTEAGYARFRDACLTCHAGYETERPANANFERSAANQPGVQCTYCHQVGDQSEWIDHHSRLGQTTDWRLLSATQKAAHGMRNLSDAGSQAELCVSCHVGDHKRGMFVSHDMYVAGHPPLPAFELQTFTEALPPHWRDIPETYASLSNYPQRDAYFSLNHAELQGPPAKVVSETMWQTRSLLLGAVSAAEQAVGLVAEADQAWGDYALYDCAACHHELRLPSWRQARGAGTTPGRPRLAEWPTPLLELGLSLVDTPASAIALRDALDQAVSATPFGDPERCLPAAKAWQATLAESATRLRSLPMDAARGRQLLRELASAPPAWLGDYQSGRQVVWAIRLIDAELATLGQPLDAECRRQIAALVDGPAGSLVSLGPPAPRTATAYAEVQAAELQRMASYDGTELQKRLQALRQRLP